MKRAHENPGLIQPLPSATPENAPAASAPDRRLPADLLREASNRVAIVALLSAVTWVVADVLWHLTWPYANPGRSWPGFSAPDGVAATAAALSLALYAYIRKADKPPEFVLRLALGYMILTCFALGLTMHWGLPLTSRLQPSISWVGVVFLIFAAIAPNDPRRMLVASLIGASMNPLAMVLTNVHGMGAGAAVRTGLLMHYQDFLLAGIAAVISSVVTRLGRQVGRAREMGSYQLGELIKKGGMGEVYRASHRMLARPAAIKLIRGDMLGANDGESADLAVRRFRREAEAAANLRSPHTVELFDFGITEDQTLYFVMEYLDGVDLETLVRENGPLPARRVIHILKQCCESLEEAHGQGLVHRDIKPANIHLGKVGIAFDFVKVLDFGLVKSVVKEDSEISLATAVGRTPGTPSYMAPEMALGEGVDGRSDIYALGCVGYFLLTGRLVFDAESTFQMIAKHMRNDPVPPSVRAKVEVPQALENLILRCLAKDPSARPQSARELRAALVSLRIPEWTQAEAEMAFQSPLLKRAEPTSPQLHQ
jgi:tRNA A-37 threonylcarbamoyl transferase component Bud32